MGSVLMFLAFMGIAAIIRRIGAVSAESADSTGAPTDEEREDIKRRIREILGQPTEPTVTTTTPLPAGDRAEIPQPRQATLSPEGTTSVRPPKRAASVTPKRAGVLSKNSPFKTQQAQTAAQTSSPTPSPAKSEIESAMEDFSLERAVIYSEILEPKFKEY